MLESFFATVGIFLASIFGGPPVDLVATVPSQPAAVVAAFSNEDAPINVTTSAQRTPPSDATTTIVKNYITQPVIERTIQSAPLAGYVTQEDLASQIEQVTNTFGRLINGRTYPTPATTYSDGGIWGAISLSNRIEHLSDITVDGVSGLTASDIPSLSYLPLSGGIVTGDLTVTNATSSSLFATLGRFTTGIIDTLTATAATITNLIATTITAASATFTNATTTAFAATGVAYFGGNVGIGTTTPAYSLDVFGTINGLAMITKDPYLDVRAFGAVGNGVADDTAAIVAAIAASAANTIDGTKRSGVVFFPCGTYNFTGLNITVPVVLQGSNANCTKLKYTPTTGTAITENYASGLHDTLSPGMRDLKLQGPLTNYAVDQSTVGLLLGGTNGAHAFRGENLDISGFGLGITFGNNAYLTVIETTSVHGNYVNMVYPASLTNSGENLVFRDSTFSDSGEFYVPGVAGACVEFLGGAVEAVFDGGSFDNCRVNIPSGSGSHISFVSNHFETPGGYVNVPNVTLSDFYSTVTMTSPNFYNTNVGAATALVTASAGTITATGLMAINTGTTSIPLFALSGTARLNVFGVGRTTGFSSVASNSGTGNVVMSDQTTGYFGIATTSPAYPFDVGGFINTTGTGGGYKIDGYTMLYASSTNFATFVGQQAGAGIISNATSSLNGTGATAIGYQAMQNATSGVLTSRSTAVGYQALRGSSSNITGNWNSALGFQALTINTTGSQNTAFGYLTLTSNTTGGFNTAGGSTAMQSNTTGGSNTAYGEAALFWNQTGSNNVAVGYNTGGGGNGSTASFSSGTFLGYKAGFLQTGNGNIFIGYHAATTTTSGNNNIAIGYDIALRSTTGSNQLNIGNIIYGTGINGTSNTVSTGNIAIGTSTPYSKLTVWGNDALNTSLAFNVVSSASSTLFAVTNAGNVGVATTSPWRTLSVTGTVGFDGLTGSTGAGSLCLDSNKQVVYNSGSDACLSSTRATKHDINPLTVNAFSQLAALQPVSFIYNNDASSTVRYGFIAEDTAAVDTHLTTYDASGNISGIDDRSIIAIVVDAIRHFADAFTTKELTFVRASGDELTVKKLCVEDVCVTRDQFVRMVEQSGQVPVSSSPTPSEPQVDDAVLSPSDESEPTDEASDAEIVLEVPDAPSIVPTDTPEEIPAAEPDTSSPPTNQ